MFCPKCGNEISEDPCSVCGYDRSRDYLCHPTLCPVISGVGSADQDADGKEAAFLYKWNGTGSEGDDLCFNASHDGKTNNFTVESLFCDKDSDVYKAVKNLKIGDKIDLEGFLYWYEGVNPHITSVKTAK